MAWDLSAVRPWEWWPIIAEEWIEAQAVQAAYRDGQADARDEAKAKRGQQE
jgi:hypothetical protein